MIDSIGKRMMLSCLKSSEHFAATRKDSLSSSDIDRIFVLFCFFVFEKFFIVVKYL